MQKYWRSSSDGQREIVSVKFVEIQVGREEQRERERERESESESEGLVSVSDNVAGQLWTKLLVVIICIVR